MPHTSKNKNTDTGSSQKESSPRIKRKKQSGRRQRIFVFSLVAVLIVIIAGAFYYQFNIAPFRRAVVTVDGNAVRMDYFLKRAKLLGSDTTSVLQQLVDEEIIKIDAPKLGIQVTDEDLNKSLRDAAASAIAAESGTTATETTDTSVTTTTTTTTTTSATSITDDEYNKWYRAQVTQSGLSDSEYREVMRMRLMAVGVQNYLASQIPQSAEQVHLHVILVGSVADANTAKNRITAGETFADVAKSVSLDTNSVDNGGDLGWVPKGAYGYESTTFALNIGQVSDPVAVDSSNPDTSEYLLFMVSEKAADRTIDQSSIELLQSNYFNGWLYQQMSAHTITVKYDFNKVSNQTWISWQLAKIPNATLSVSTISAAASTSTTTTPVVTNTVNTSYTFGLFSDEACTVPISNSSSLDFGPVPQGTIITKTIYIKNLGEEISEPVIIQAISLNSGLGMAGGPVTLEASGSSKPVDIYLGAGTKQTIGTYSFTVMFSRGTLTGGYSLFIPGKVSVTAAPETTETTETTTPAATITTTTTP